jgi:hypothetical protein
MSDTHKNQQYISCYGYDRITKNHSLGSGGTPLGMFRVNPYYCPFVFLVFDLPKPNLTPHITPDTISTPHNFVVFPLHTTCSSLCIIPTQTYKYALHSFPLTFLANAEPRTCRTMEVLTTATWRAVCSTIRHCSSEYIYIYMCVLTLHVITGGAEF